jgi:hypothetical protein
MPSTDIDGTVMVILTTAEARRVYEHLRETAGGPGLDTVEHNLAAKIARNLELPPLG